MKRALQQFAIRSAMKNEKRAAEVLAEAAAAGYEGIEICGFLTRKIPLIVRGFAAMAGMPIGACCKLDWHRLISDSGLAVVSVHEDLGTISSKPDFVAGEAESFGTDTVVITGMFKFDYGDASAVERLADDLNAAGRLMKDRGMRLLYHNHNCELCRTDRGRAFDIIIERTDPELVNFEFDSYWIAEAGADPRVWMDRLGRRMKLWHINDRGFRAAGKTASIRKSDGMELGFGNMPLAEMAAKAASFGTEAAVLENHANWIDNDPVRSMLISAAFMNENIK